MSRPMRATMGAAALAAMLVLAGCTGELVGGGQRDVEVTATGDGTGGGSPSLAPRYAVAEGRGPAFQANGISGTIRFDLAVSLMRNGASEWLATAANLPVAANGRDTVLVTSGSVFQVPYPTVRVTFTRVQANVTNGLAIGGVTLTGQVNVAIADSVVVEVPLDAGETDEDIRLLIDLDASAWLAAANPLTRVVPAEAFRAAVKVRRR